MIHPQLPTRPPSGSDWLPVLDITGITYELMHEVLECKQGRGTNTGYAGVYRDKNLKYNVTVSLDAAVGAGAVRSGWAL